MTHHKQTTTAHRNRGAQTVYRAAYRAIRSNRANIGSILNNLTRSNWRAVEAAHRTWINRDDPVNCCTRGVAHKLRMYQQRGQYTL